jgi:hypothetical protein
VYITITLTDTHSNAFSDVVDGTITSAISMRRASGSNVSVTAPTATNTTLLTNDVVVPVLTYSVSPDITSVNEGSTVTFNITTTLFGSGTLYWTNGGTTTGADFSGGANSGSVAITSNSGSFTRTLVSDSLTEGSESIIIQLRTGSTSGPVVATAATVTVNDTSIAPAGPTYTLVSAPTISAPSGLSTSGTLTISSNSVWSPGSVAGIASMWQSSTNNVTFYNALAASSYAITSADNGYYFRLRQSDPDYYNATVSNVLGPVAISAPVATYSIYSYPLSINEGDTGTFSVQATNGPTPPYTLWWNVNHISTANADFSATSGSFVMNASTGTFPVAASADLTTEGSQTFTVSLSLSNGGPAVDTTSSITINDTSLAPVVNYSLASPTVIDEGSSGTFNLATTNVANGTTLYWTITNITTTNTRFSATSGSFTISSNAGVFYVTPIADNLTEGSTTFSVNVRTGSTSGTVVSTSPSITINDTSLTPTPAITSFSIESSTYTNEGASATFYVGTSNIANGTSMSWSVGYVTGASSADFGTTSGSFTINSNAGTFSIAITADYLTEGVESYNVTVSGGGATPYTSPSYGIYDTTLTPAGISIICSSISTSGSYPAWTLSGGYPGETGLVSWSGPASGSFYFLLNSSGNYYNYSGDLGAYYGNFTLSWSFSRSTQTPSRSITNQPPTPTVNYVSTIARYPTTFSWTVSGGLPGETFSAVWSGANSGSFSFVLDGGGSYDNGGGSWFPNPGIVNMTFTFNSSYRVNTQTVYKTITVT